MKSFSKTTARVNELAKITFSSPYLINDIQVVRKRFKVPYNDYSQFDDWHKELVEKSKEQLQKPADKEKLSELITYIEQGKHLPNQDARFEKTILVKYWRNILKIAKQNSIPYGWLKPLHRYVLGWPFENLLFPLPFRFNTELDEHGDVISINIKVDAPARYQDIQELWTKYIAPNQKRIPSFNFDRIGKQKMFDIGLRIIELRNLEGAITNKEISAKVSKEFDKDIQPFELDNYIRFVHEKYKILRKT